MQYIAETREFQIKEKTVVSIGKFDGLHRGHQKLMHEMLKWKEQGFKIAVFTFATPPWTLVKGKMQTMIMTNPEREMLLEQVGVDYIVEYPFDEEVCHMGPEQFISDILVGRMNAGVIVSGPDCHFGYKAAGDCAMLERLSGKYGYRYFIVDKERDEEGKIISSTYIREMLADGNIRKANDLLDRAYKAVSDGESDPAGCEASSEVRRLCDAGDCGRKGLRRPYKCRSETDDLRG